MPEPNIERRGGAAESAREARLEAVRRALAGAAREGEPPPCVAALFEATAVVDRGGALARYRYAMRGGEAILSDLEDAGDAFRAAEERTAEAFGAASPEPAADASGSAPGARWRVRVIRAGASANGTYYPEAALRAAAPLFAGARVLVRSDEDHIAGRGADVRNIAGRIAAPRWAEGAGAPGEIRAELELLDPSGPVGRLLAGAHARGMTGLMGLSIVARGRARVGEIEDDGRRRAVTVVESIDRVDSVDLVVEPAAGGALIGLVEAVCGASAGRAPAPSPDNDRKEDDAMRERMRRYIETQLGGARLEGLPAADAGGHDDALEALYREAAAAPARAAAANGAETANGAAAETAEIERRAAEAALAASRAEARARAAESGLPAAARERLASRFGAAGADALGGPAVEAAIAAERAYLAAAAPGGQVSGLGAAGAARAARVTESRAEKVAAMWDALFDPAGGRRIGLREAYIETTGDRRVTGRLRDCDAAALREAAGARVAEAVTTSALAEIMGDSIARRMIADYRETGVYDGWTRWCAAATIGDFRTQRRVRWGGYANLPTVAEAADYAAVSTPGDEEETYTPKKRGGIETLSLEAIRNDDLGAAMRIPVMLSRSAKRTLSAFAASFLTGNAALADGKALFHADHGNLGAAALSASALSAARLAMVKQKEPASGKALGIGPRCLLVPFDLEEKAVDLFRRSTNRDRTFAQSLALEVVPVAELTDVNDWYLAADPAEIPTVEIGFLDGMREPELFVQDSPTAGSLFSADKMSWKIRHVYGGAALDYRGLYKAAVG